LCHYSNLQPLWANENLSKGSKILWHFNTVGWDDIPITLNKFKLNTSSFF
jgi:hypothetical protein